MENLEETKYVIEELQIWMQSLLPVYVCSKQAYVHGSALLPSLTWSCTCGTPKWACLA